MSQEVHEQLIDDPEIWIRFQNVFIVVNYLIIFSFKETIKTNLVHLPLP